MKPLLKLHLLEHKVARGVSCQRQRPFIILFGPQLSAESGDEDVMLQSPHHLVCGFFWCVFLLYKRQDHYFQSAAWQIGWMENIFWAWQLKEYCWLHLNDRKRSGLFFIIGMLQENEKRMKVPTSDKTHRRAHPETKNSAPNSCFSWPHAGVHFLKLLHKGCQDSSYIHYTEMLQNMRVQGETKAPSHFVMFNKAPK